MVACGIENRAGMLFKVHENKYRSDNWFMILGSSRFVVGWWYSSEMPGRT